MSLFVPVRDPLQVKIHWFKKLEFCGFVIASHRLIVDGVMRQKLQIYQCFRSRHISGNMTAIDHLRASLCLAFDVSCVRVFYLKLLPTVERFRE